MSRQQAIEKAAQAIIDKLDAGTQAGTTLGFKALRDALALPDDTAEPVAYITAKGLESLRANVRSAVRVWRNADPNDTNVPLYPHPPKDTAERDALVALLKECDEAMAWQLNGEPLDTLMIAARGKIHAYLTGKGGAA